MQVSLAQQKMVVGGRHINVAALERLAITGVRGRQWTSACENLWKPARPSARLVQHGAERRVQVTRKRRDQAHERLDAACRGSNNDDVWFRHQPAPHGTIWLF